MIWLILFGMDVFAFLVKMEQAIRLWVMKFYELEKTDEYNHYQAILRCQREYVDEVRASLALIYKHNRKDISVSTIGLSGTIKACQKFIEK